MVASLHEEVQNDDVWLDHRPPMDFDTFCVEMDGSELTARQYKVFSDTGMLSPYSWINPSRKLNEIVLEWGKGSGKGYTSAKLCAYIAYVVRSMKPDPASFITRNQPSPLARGTKLEIVNVAPNEELARNVFFHYLRGFLAHPMFFRFNPKILSDRVIFCSDEEMAAAKAQKRDPNYTLGIFSKNSRGSGLDGFNLLFWFMDEADAFESTENRSNAKEIYNIFASSAGTRMGNCWTGVIASYPRVEGGFMETIYDAAVKNMAEKGADASMYGDKAATWDVRPGVDREHVAQIAKAYEDDPKDAASKYECLPMATVEGFFEFTDRIEAAVDESRSPVAHVTSENLDLPSENGKLGHYITALLGHISPSPGHAYFLGGDAGKDGDAYALSVFHTDETTDAPGYICPKCGWEPESRMYARYVQQPTMTRMPYDESILCGSCGIDTFGSLDLIPIVGGTMRLDGWWVRSGLEIGSGGVISDGRGRTYNLPTVYEDLIVQVKPSRATRPGEVTRPVYFPGIYELCLGLVENLPVRMARFDKWNTADITQRLVSATGRDIAEISFAGPEQYRRARLIKSMLYANQIVLLPNKERDREWRRLQRVNGGSVNHPKGIGESKDIFDAESVAIWCAATSQCQQLEATWI